MRNVYHAQQGAPNELFMPYSEHGGNYSMPDGMGEPRVVLSRRQSTSGSGAGGVPQHLDQLEPSGSQGSSQYASHPAQNSAEPPSTTSSSGPRPIRRRMRMITSCLECRRRKLKCNKSTPCTNCLKFNRECVYLGPKLDEASQLRLTEIKEKVGSLERQLERDVAKATSKADAQQRILADDVEGQDDEERDLEITPMVALDLAYEDDPDGTDDIIDLGIQVGRMRITERIGGLSRPRLSEEVRISYIPTYAQLWCIWA